MSLETKHTYARALDLLGNFQNLIKPEITCERWEVVGSVRRRKPAIGDMDICAIPRFGDVPTEGDLFAAPVRRNLLWQRVDDLVKLGTFTRHVKDTLKGPRENWGDLQRSIAFMGLPFEIRICDPDNWALKLVIHTGPEAMSKYLVSRDGLPKRGFTIKDGFHLFDGNGVERKGLTERDVFRLAGLAYTEPHQRG